MFFIKLRNKKRSLPEKGIYNFDIEQEHCV